MKILHVLDHSLPLHSGYSFRTVSILQEQRALGWETAHVTGPKHTQPGPPVEVVEGWTFYRAPPLARFYDAPLVRELATIFAIARRISEVAKIEKPDILHAHSPALNGIAALYAGRKLGLPVVYEVRGLWEDAAVDHGTSAPNGLRYRATRALETYVLRNCAAVTTICEGLRGELVGRGLPAGKVTLIPNAVDPHEFAFDREEDVEFRRQHGLEGKIVIGFIGSFYAYEGLDLLVRALPAMVARNPEIALLLVGGGPAEQRLRELVDELGIADAIRFLGRVPHADVQRYYNLVDVFVYPRHSIRLTELVTPLKPLEAMARGRIVLASDVGGHRELVRDNETGFLFRADDVTALVEAMSRILAKREDWPRIHRTARDFIERERTWRHSVERYDAPYAKVLAVRPSGA